MKKVYQFRMILFGWTMFGLGLFASGHFGGKLAMGYTIVSTTLLLIYDSCFDKIIKMVVTKNATTRNRPSIRQ